MKYTTFCDMASGGREKTPYAIIIIQGEEAQAVERFKNEFERDPHNVTCDCCGPDFSVWEHETREDAVNAYGEGYHCYVVED